MPAPRVVVMNDTAGRGHHGCARVMRLLRAGLARQGLQITAASPAHADWTRDRDFLRHLAQADLVVINGEGTLHHGRPGGRRLLEVVRHPQRRAPVALINALWQENPAEWHPLLAGCALISARDAPSGAAMAAAVGPERLRVVPDLSLSAGPEAQPGPRAGVIVGDSVRMGARQALARAARRLGAQAILPTKTLRGRAWAWPGIRHALQGVYNGAWPLGAPPLRLAADEAAYLAALGRARMHVTGRFHAVCLSLVTGTPVLALGSNSWKIEALMAEAGLDPGRLLSEAELAALSPAGLDRPYSPAEETAIAAFLARARAEAEGLFADLARLAREGA